MASKTTRRASRAARAAKARPNKHEQHGPLLIPLNKGRHAYVLDGVSQPQTKTIHVETFTPAFVSALRPLVEAGKGDQLREQMKTLGWEDQLAYLEKKGLFSSNDEN